MPFTPFKVKAVYEYNSAEPDDLTFPNGQIITVTEASDDDWYTGEYTSASGEQVEGIFPRNFVEKYEPAIPSRPARAPKKAPVAEHDPEPPTPRSPPAAQLPPQSAPVAEPEPEVPKPAPEPATSIEEPVSTKMAELAQPPAAPVNEPKSPPAKRGPPPIAEKPTGNSFKDRIAAFNKPAAAPVAPFKPGGSAATGFIKKPFVAPPPSKNAYVPPPRELPPQRVFHREEESSEHSQPAERAAPLPVQAEDAGDDDQPKLSLKDRIAALQKQQMEQAQRQAEPAQKKEKPKRPPKKRSEPVEEPELAPEPALERLDTNETVGKPSLDLSGESDSGRPSLQRQESAQSARTPLQPPRELVSDTNDADDSGAADTEDAQEEVSTEEDRPVSKGGVSASDSKRPVPQQAEAEEGDGEDDEEDTEEDEDPEVRRKRELRERMAKMSGGMGMMGMFGAPGGAAPPPRKPRQSQEHTRESENRAQEEAARAPPVPIMALPGMSNQLSRRSTEAEDADSDEDEHTERPTPNEPSKQSDADDDYISQPPPPPRRTETMRSSASLDRPAPPPPPQREEPHSPRELRAVPPPPPSTSKSFSVRLTSCLLLQLEPYRLRLRSRLLVSMVRLCRLRSRQRLDDPKSMQCHLVLPLLYRQVDRDQRLPASKVVIRM